jgi:hypothetical protein
MPSNDTAQAARRERDRLTDQALAADRQGRDRARRRADRPGPGGLDPDVSRRLPNTSPGGRP